MLGKESIHAGAEFFYLVQNCRSCLYIVNVQYGLVKHPLSPLSVTIADTDLMSFSVVASVHLIMLSL